MAQGLATNILRNAGGVFIIIDAENGDGGLSVNASLPIISKYVNAKHLCKNQMSER